jgi:hypothetical protein
METRFLEFARSPKLSGSMMWQDHVITRCGEPVCLAQVFVAKAHSDIGTIAIAQGGLATGWGRIVDLMDCLSPPERYWTAGTRDQLSRT